LLLVCHYFKDLLAYLDREHILQHLVELGPVDDGSKFVLVVMNVADIELGFHHYRLPFKSLAGKLETYLPKAVLLKSGCMAVALAHLQDGKLRILV
jgi:hypothetical protein